MPFVMKHIKRSKFTKRDISSSAIPIAGLLFFLFLIVSEYPSLPLPPLGFTFFSNVRPPPADSSCSGRYIYVYDLPSRFNTDLLLQCKNLDPWNDKCDIVANSGMGLPLNDSTGVLPKAGWYATDQFILDVIFHNRMKQYKCRTTNSSIAEAVYVPFYGGLDIGRHLWGYNISVRDSLSLDLAQWLKSRPEWQLHRGRDHFFVLGRIPYDYTRMVDEDKSWGNKLMTLPETQNFTLITVESDFYFSAKEASIPYPTYFHPSNEGQLASWQERVRSSNRPWLFSFAGGRRPQDPMSIRDHLIKQCEQSNKCTFLKCGSGENNCEAQHFPPRIIKFLEHSTFCLQPTGDSYTRRSTFDSILSGCIPVFFHPGTAYTQYLWYFPKNYSEYSVFIAEDEVREGKVRIEEVLLKYNEEQVRKMRENVINMIPHIVYTDSRYGVENVRDAFDVAIDGVIERVKTLKGGFAPYNPFSDGKWGRFFGRNS